VGAAGGAGGRGTQRRRLVRVRHSRSGIPSVARPRERSYR
jgi:hypothetical protein